MSAKVDATVTELREGTEKLAEHHRNNHDQIEQDLFDLLTTL